MREQFVTTFMTTLSDKIDDDSLKIVFKQLTIFVNNYEIKKRETSLTLYEGYLPECYQVYFVTRKIEGLSLGCICIKFSNKENSAIEHWTAGDQRSMRF